jgi:hypothetical protein
MENDDNNNDYDSDFTESPAFPVHKQPIPDIKPLDPNDIIFSFNLNDLKKTNNFLKVIESISNVSDTCLFKINKRGLFIKLTDFESFCCMELRVTNEYKSLISFSAQVEQFEAKIYIESLLHFIKRAHKNKNGIILAGYSTNPFILYVHEVISLSQGLFHTSPVESSESRPRIYYNLSLRSFKLACHNKYIYFIVPANQFAQMISQLSIFSGVCGGVGEILAEYHGHKNQGFLCVDFHIKNNSGCVGNYKIFTKEKSNIIPIIECETNKVCLKYFFTYFKRIHQLISSISEEVHLFLSEKGILLNVSIYEKYFNVLIFISDVSCVDLKSYI